MVMNHTAERILFLTFVFSVHTMISHSQNTFLKIYGGTKNEYLHSMIRSHDGGFIMAGSTESYGQGNYGVTDDYIVKTDSEGNLLWTKTLDLQSYDDIYWIEPTHDSSYVICGIASDNDTSIGILLAKINESGNTEWEKVMGQNEGGIGYCVRQTTDGGYIIAAEILPVDNIDFLLIKTDESGNVQWSKEIGSEDQDVPFYVMQTSDGGYFAAGFSIQNSATLPIYAVKTDAGGTVVWQQTYSTSPPFSRSGVAKVIATKDGGYLLTGANSHDELYNDIMLLKIDSGGNAQWAKAYGGGQDEYCGSMTEDQQGNFVVCGGSNSAESSGNYDGLVMLIDTSGNLIQSSLFGKTFADDDFSAIIRDNDGGFTLAGTTSSFGQNLSSDFYMLRIDSNFNGPSCFTLSPFIFETDFPLTAISDFTESDLTISESDVTAFIDSGGIETEECSVATGEGFPPPGTFSVYPNPSNGSFTIEINDPSLNEHSLTVHLLNDESQVVFSSEEPFSDAGSNINFSLPSSIASGIYLVQIIGGQKVYETKLILNTQQ